MFVRGQVREPLSIEGDTTSGETPTHVSATISGETQTHVSATTYDETTSSERTSNDTSLCIKDIPNDFMIFDRNIWRQGLIKLDNDYLHIHSEVVVSPDRDNGSNVWYMYSLIEELEVLIEDDMLARLEDMNGAYTLLRAIQNWLDIDDNALRNCAWCCLGKPVIQIPVILDYYGRAQVYTRGEVVATIFTSVKVKREIMTAFFLVREDFRDQRKDSSTILRFNERMSVDPMLGKELNHRIDCLVHAQVHFLLDLCKELFFTFEQRDFSMCDVFRRDKHHRSGVFELELVGGRRRKVYDCPYCEDGHKSP